MLKQLQFFRHNVVPLVNNMIKSITNYACLKIKKALYKTYIKQKKDNNDIRSLKVKDKPKFKLVLNPTTTMTLKKQR